MQAVMGSITQTSLHGELGGDVQIDHVIFMRLAKKICDTYIGNFSRPLWNRILCKSAIPQPHTYNLLVLATQTTYVSHPGQISTLITTQYTYHEK
jgi:hypothetical protein